MNNLLVRKTRPSSVSSRKQFPSQIHRLFYLFTGITATIALVTSVILLLSDGFLTFLPHASLSAAPLLLIGAAYLGFQAFTQPKPLELFRAFIVSSAFILWGIDQLLPSGWLATTLGDVVITLYVLDLSWMILERLKQKNIVTN